MRLTLKFRTLGLFICSLQSSLFCRTFFFCNGTFSMYIQLIITLYDDEMRTHVYIWTCFLFLNPPPYLHLTELFCTFTTTSKPQAEKKSDRICSLRQRPGSVRMHFFGQIFSAFPGHCNFCSFQLSSVSRSEQERIYNSICFPVDSNVGGPWGHEEVSIMG